MNDLYLVYGKIIIDTIRLRSGALAPGQLGGGGPQAAFGMRLWHTPVALLSRSGADIDPEHLQTLEQLDLDLTGWVRYADVPTPRGLLEYDEHEYMHSKGLMTSEENWQALLSRPLALSDEHLKARAIHLVTELGNEPMVDTAFGLRQAGALMSLEPIFDAHSCPDPAALFDLSRHVDLLSPDWPAATHFAGTTEPQLVLRFWSSLGPRAVAIRHGAHGSYVWDRDHGQGWHIPILDVSAVDPTGAGNAYGGGWCAGWQQTHDARLAGCYGTVAAALMISHPGMPHLQADTRQVARTLLEHAQQRAIPISS